MATRAEMEDFLMNLVSDLCSLLGLDDPTEESSEEE
jgi:hypothetical protein